MRLHITLSSWGTFPVCSIPGGECQGYKLSAYCQCNEACNVHNTIVSLGRRKSLLALYHSSNMTFCKMLACDAENSRAMKPCNEIVRKHMYTASPSWQLLCPSHKGSWLNSTGQEKDLQDASIGLNIMFSPSVISSMLVMAWLATCRLLWLKSSIKDLRKTRIWKQVKEKL
jgi:hypothetical protein